MIDFTKLLQFVGEQILWSNLVDSTIHGTGFEREDLSQEAEYLQGLPIMVQVVAFTEVVRPDKPRAFMFKLSDGENVVDAFAHASLLGNNVDFDNFKLGYKVGLSPPL